MLVGFAVWIAAHTARVKKTGERRIERRARQGRVAGTDADPIADPGLEPHLPRPTDVDPAAERRAERQVALLFGLSAVFTVLCCVSYFVFQIGDDPDVIGGLGASNMAIGGFLGLALLCIGVGAIQWARKLMGDHEIIEMRHPAASSDEDREEALEAFNTGVTESGIGRRPLIRNSLLGAMGALGLPAVIFLRDLGPLPGQQAGAHGLEEEHARRAGRHRRPDQAVRPRDRPAGQRRAGASSTRTDPTASRCTRAPRCCRPRPRPPRSSSGCTPTTSRPARTARTGASTGILCFSKICTHVGCPISLWEQQTHHLLCPCHQSTFDLADNGRVIFGPAARSLPQLPIMVDKAGYLVAQSDFTEPVGPSYWERG